MLENLARGDRFQLSLYDLNRPPRVPTLALPNIPADFVQVSDRRYHLGDLQMVRNAGPGEPPARPAESGAGRERNFLWLPFLPGKVTYAHPPAGLPIITGLMSGCWLACFRMNGQSYFGHIGTEDLPRMPNSLQAKNAWKISVGRGMISHTNTFNPAAHGHVSGTGDAVFGALSADNHFYSIDCKKGTGGTFAVLGVMQVTGQPIVAFMD
jgi:hypothetical protein